MTIEELIEKLTNQKGDTLTILARDPEAMEKVVTIDICGQWTDWKDLRYEGRDLAHALRQAEIVKRIHTA